MTPTAAAFLPQTEYAQKLRQKQKRYIDKQKENKPQITPENELRIRDLVTQTAFSIRHLNFALKLLKKEGVLDKLTLIIDVMPEFERLENFFVGKESAANPNWKDGFNDYENFIWNFLNHTPEKKERIMRFAESLWNKKH